MTMYQSSKGPVDISTMPLRYAANALAKLNRDTPERTDEIEAIAKHVAALEAEISDENPRAVIGGNNPPEETPVDAPASDADPRAAIQTHAADLLTEAANWADGTAIENEGQAAEVGKLHRALQDAAALVADCATKEKKPHNDALNAIGAWQNGYTAKDLKKTPDGSLTKAIAATGRLSAGWLQKLEDDRKAREKVAADEAFAAARAAISLREEAKETTDLAVMDRAEDALAGAEALLRQAKGVAKEKVNVSVEGFRPVALRSVWRADLVDAPNSYALAYGHYKQNPEFMSEFQALIRRWAERDARTEATRCAGVPGFNFREEKVV